MTVAITLCGRRTISTPITQPLHGLSNAERRDAEQKLWRNGYVGAVIVHLVLFLIFLLWWGEGELVSPFAAAGPRAGDDLAASGGMQAITIRLPPPRPIIRPQVPLLSFDPVPLEEFEDDQQTQVETSSILGDRPGVDGPGLPDATGRGDGGNAASGLFRNVPPSPRGMIIPPANRSIRGQKIEVWVWVDIRGRVVADRTQLRPPSSDRGFNERLVREAAEWVFEPAKRGGRPVASWFTYTISM